MLVKLTRALILLAAVLLSPHAMAGDVTFTGEVAYRERIALPPRAELWVTLVSLPRATPVVSAAASVGASGQVPLHFSLHVRSDVIATGGSYGLIAEIRAEGRTLFRNSQPVPVDVTAPLPTGIVVSFSPDPPHDAVDQILLPPERPGPLLDTAWQVTSIGGDPVRADTEVTLSIAADLRAGGNGGCNNYFTEAGFEGPPLTFGPIAGTRMACSPEIMDQEAALFAALEATVDYELSGDALKLFDAAGIPLVGLIRLP